MGCYLENVAVGNGSCSLSLFFGKLCNGTVLICMLLFFADLKFGSSSESVRFYILIKMMASGIMLKGAADFVCSDFPWEESRD